MQSKQKEDLKDQRNSSNRLKLPCTARLLAKEDRGIRKRNMLLDGRRVSVSVSGFFGSFLEVCAFQRLDSDTASQNTVIRTNSCPGPMHGKSLKRNAPVTSETGMMKERKSSSLEEEKKN